MRCFTAAALLLALASAARVDDEAGAYGARKAAPNHVDEDVVDKAVRLAEEAERVKIGLIAGQAFSPAGSNALLHVSEEPAEPEPPRSPILSRFVPDNSADVPPLPSPEPQASDAEKMAANPVTPEVEYSEQNFLADRVDQMMGTTEQPVHAESYMPIEEALVNVHMHGTKPAHIKDVEADKELIDTMADMEAAASAAAAAAAKATTTAAPATAAETATTAAPAISLAESGPDLVDQAVAAANKAEAEMDRMVMGMKSMEPEETHVPPENLIDLHAGESTDRAGTDSLLPPGRPVDDLRRIQELYVDAAVPSPVEGKPTVATELKAEVDAIVARDEATANATTAEATADGSTTAAPAAPAALEAVSLLDTSSSQTGDSHVSDGSEVNAMIDAALQKLEKKHSS